MTTPIYPHAQLVIDWMNGVPIDYETSAGEWHPLEPPSVVDKMPHFYVDNNYRRRPIKARYRVARSQNGRTVTADTLADEHRIAGSSDFDRWLTDWIDYEI